MKAPLLQCENVHFAYEENVIFEGLNLSIQEHEFIGIVGPNACGKTSLLKLLTGILQAKSGKIFFKEKPLQDYSRRQIAKSLAVLPQDTVIDFPFTALEIVLMGRAPYLGAFTWESTEDLRVAYQAMELTDCLSLAKQDIRELSGGQRERVFLARALAQEPTLLLLDEPTTHLDLKHQQQIFYLLKKLHKEKKLTLIVILHDLNFAMQACERILMLNQRKIIADGKPQEVLNAKNISEVFEVDVQVEATSHSQLPWIQLKPPRWSHNDSLS